MRPINIEPSNRPPRSFKKIAIAISSTLLVLAAAACGSGSAGGAGADGSKEILVGFSTPKTGPTVAYDQDTQAMIAYFKTVNDAGGVNGYRYTWKEVDNQGTVAGGATSVRSLIASEPFAIAIIRTSSFSGAVQILRQQYRENPVFALASGAAIKEANLPNVFGLYTDYNEEALFGVGNLVTNLGHKRIGLLYDPTLDPKAPETVPPHVTKLGGSVVKQVAAPPETTDFVSLVQQMKDARVDAVFLDTTLPTTAGFLKAARQTGLTVDMGTFSGNLDPSLFSVAGKAAEGLYINSLYPPLDSDHPEIAKFREATKKYAPNAFTGQGENGWAAAIVFNTAVSRATQGGKELTVESFKNELYKMYGETLGFTKIAYRKGGQYAIGGMESLAVYRVRDGKFVKP